MSVVVRPCAPKDLKDILRLIKEIAVIYNVPLTQLYPNMEVLHKDGFGERPKFECFVAEAPPEQKSKEGHTIVGYILSAYTYSTWKGKNLYVDNFYVMPEFRGRRIGKKLMSSAAESAWARGCTEFRMHSSSKKPENYAVLQRFGGGDLSAKHGWNLLRFYNDAVQKRAAQSKV
ncbi:thialysine N-epsilon-acetyltransferase [Anolis carolinensis]|uniref:thialysine N-epsilon-acetyltransferase n=1 Tax=Anolis carolinensis TaxID=28377 RepID=UPI000462A446|nr:PREDICTED: diamine acetyltransferase 2 [Anolis carolinensis]|eukprot:XP_008123966.1 PREDICTED: diamine acetyltransferase 2 [Anolis carolinensis]